MNPDARQDAGGDAIHEIACRCAKAFDDFLRSVNIKPRLTERLATLFRQDPAGQLIITPADVQDDYEQFRVWARNLGVFTQDHGSLDYRLRTADDVKRGISSLLHSLTVDLLICTNLVAGDRPIPIHPSYDDEDSSTSSDSDVTSVIDVSSSPSQRTAQEIQIRLANTSNIIGKLFTIAEAMRASGIHKQTIKAATYVLMQDGIDQLAQFENNYLPKVLEVQFSVKSPLLERLTKAIALRRRRFMYQARHQKRKIYGGDLFKSLALQPTGSFFSRSVGGDEKKPAEQHVNEVVRADAPESYLTKATTFEVSMPRMRAPSRIVSGTSKSVATGTDVLIPPPPQRAARATHFGCPYCCVLISKEKQDLRLWRQHVIDDLQPFVCLEPDCHTPDITFASKTEWVEHQKWKHSMIWWCNDEDSSHPPLEFDDESKFREHLMTAHVCSSLPEHIESRVAAAGRPSLMPFSCSPFSDFALETSAAINQDLAETNLKSFIGRQRI